jgi:hypothetical protein
VSSLQSSLFILVWSGGQTLTLFFQSLSTPELRSKKARVLQFKLQIPKFVSDILDILISSFSSGTWFPLFASRKPARTIVRELWLKCDGNPRCGIQSSQD